MTMLEEWAGAYLVEDAIFLDLCDDKTKEGCVESERAAGVRDNAMRHLLEDRATTPTELRAKVTVALEEMRLDAFHNARDILNAVMFDLTVMEIKAKAQAPKRVKYHCAACDFNVYSTKNDLKLTCSTCQHEIIEAT